MDSIKSMSCHKPTKRSLNFSVKGDGSTLSFTVDESESPGHFPGHRTVPVAEPNISDLGAIPQKSKLKATKLQFIHVIVQERCNHAKDHSFSQTGEAEEHVDLLEKLVPDWIRRKATSSGDIMFSVKRVPNIEHALSRLIST